MVSTVYESLMVNMFLIVGLVAYVDLDERAIDALREFNEEGALTVLQQFKESDLSHVQVTTSMDLYSFSSSGEVLCSCRLLSIILLFFLISE